MMRCVFLGSFLSEVVFFLFYDLDWVVLMSYEDTFLDTN